MEFRTTASRGLIPMGLSMPLFLTALNPGSHLCPSGLHADGSRDLSLAPGILNSVIAWDLSSDGWLSLAVSERNDGANQVMRLNTDGGVDTGFGWRGPLGNIRAIALQPDGKFIAGGDGEIQRFRQDGSRDPEFRATGSLSPTAAARQSDGRLVVMGTALGRLNPDGSLDASFRVTGFVEDEQLRVYRPAVAITPDRKIVVAGNLVPANGIARKNVMRFNPDGALDETFDIGTGLSQQGIPQGLGRGGLFSLAIQSDGKIIVAGMFTSFSGRPRRHLVRLNTDGSLDEAFDPGAGIGGGYENIWQILLQPDGQIQLCGSFSEFNGLPRFGIVRLNGDRNLLRLEVSRLPSGLAIRLRFNALPANQQVCPAYPEICFERRYRAVAVADERLSFELSRAATCRQAL